MCGAKRDAWRVSHVLSSSALYILGQFPHNGDWGRGPGGSGSGHPALFRVQRIKDEKQVTATLWEVGFLTWGLLLQWHDGCWWFIAAYSICPSIFVHYHWILLMMFSSIVTWSASRMSSDHVLGVLPMVWIDASDSRLPHICPCLGPRLGADTTLATLAWN